MINEGVNVFRINFSHGSHEDHIKAIGNKAVQEVSAGKKYWNGTHAILVSQSGYTKSAYKLAAANNVLLISTLELYNLDSLLN